MISGNVGTTGAVALRQAQGEGACAVCPAVAYGPRYLTISPQKTLILTLSKDEDGNAEMAFAVKGAILPARVGHRSPAGVLLP